MGIEYEIQFKYDDPKQVDDALRSALLFAGVEPAHSMYEFHSTNNPGSMPDAHACIKEYGIYFCDNGGSRKILDDIVQRITQRFVAPVVEEL